ncbi:MAG: hypothetical protein LBT97_01200 [Planctomycetota bacterium]|jgi:hypothetical protein|nr:hypothetical protein [Planctomycetota bacterium]
MATMEVNIIPDILRADVLEAAYLADVIKDIENSLPWLLDVAFREDGCRVRAGYAAENFTVPRHMALNLLKQGTRVKRGIKTRRKVAGWDENYLLELLRGDFHA